MLQPNTPIYCAPTPGGWIILGNLSTEWDRDIHYSEHGEYASTKYISHIIFWAGNVSYTVYKAVNNFYIHIIWGQKQMMVSRHLLKFFKSKNLKSKVHFHIFGALGTDPILCIWL